MHHVSDISLPCFIPSHGKFGFDTNVINTKEYSSGFGASGGGKAGGFEVHSTHILKCQEKTIGLFHGLMFHSR